ncbi:MAG: hypothetical protein ACE5G2_03650 [Candidatus Krumholzibacteriia bacterium]
MCAFRSKPCHAVRGLAVLLAAAGARAHAVEFAQVTSTAYAVTSWNSEPAWSPDGTLIAYTHATLQGSQEEFTSTLEVVILAGRRSRTVAGQATGAPLTLNSHPTWSPDGRRIAFSTNAALWITGDTDEAPAALAVEHRGDKCPAWSPDGSMIAFESALHGIVNIWVIPADGGEATRLESRGHVARNPTWSPDGTRVAFASRRSGDYDIWTMPVGGGYAHQVTTDRADDTHPSWSPDGSMIAFTSKRSGNADIWIISSKGGEATRLTAHPAEDVEPDWSPDGSRIAFTSARSGRLQIWVAFDLPPANLVLRSWRQPRRKLEH